jgi:hypothetical protein
MHKIMSNAVEEYKVGRCDIRIEIDEAASNPREDFDNVGTMVCWHRRYELGDEQPSEDGGEYLSTLAIKGNKKLARWDELVERATDRLERSVAGWDKVNDSIDRVRARLVQKALDERFVILPLYLYDHSGITMSTSPFSCPWDSGQVGVIYCSLAKAQEEWGTEDSKKRGWDGEASYTLKEDGSKRTLREATIRYLTGEVKEYDQYLTGDVYGYVVEAEDGEEESCWGFFGDIAYVKEEAEDVAKHHNERMDENDRLAAIAEAKEEAEAEYWACRDLVTK